MKKHFTLFLFILFSLSSTCINGQISKGDFMLNFNSSFSHDNFEPNIPRASFGFSYMKMISNKWMLGGDFRLSNGITTDADLAAGERLFYTYSNYQITPRLRYYFSNNKLAPFVTIDNYFSTKKYKDTNFKATTWGLWTSAGIGANYFIAKNVAIESTLTTNIIGLGENKTNTSVLNWSTGLKLFLNQGFTKSTSALASNLLKQGNFTTSANFRFNRVFGDFKQSHLAINPNIRYFLTDKLNIYVGGNYYKDESITRKTHLGGFGLGVEYFQRIIGNFYSSVNIGMASSLSSGNLKITGDQSTRNFSLVSDLKFHYFTKQKRWFLGSNFHLYEKSNSPFATGIDSFRKWNFYAGLDYFISDKFYLKTKLNFDQIISDNNPNWFKGALSFGMGYFFNASEFRF